MVESDLPPEFLHGPRTVFNSHGRIENAEDAFGRNQSLLQGRIRLGERLARFQYLPVEHDIDDELLPGHPQVAAIVEPAAIEQNGGGNADAQKFRHGRSHLLAVANLPDDLAMPLVVLVERLFHIAPGRKGLDDARAGDGFFKVAHDTAHQALRLHAPGAQGAGQTGNQESRYGQRHQRDQRKARRHIEQHGQETERQQRLPEKHVETPRHGILDFVHVVGDAGQDVALPSLGEPAHRQRGDLAKKVMSDVLHRPGLQAHHDALRQVAAQVGQKAAQDDRTAYQQQAADHPAVGNDGGKQPAEPVCHVVDRQCKIRLGYGCRRRLIVEEHRQQRAQQRIIDHAEDHRQQRQQQVAGNLPAIRPGKRQNTVKGFHDYFSVASISSRVGSMAKMVPSRSRRKTLP